VGPGRIRVRQSQLDPFLAAGEQFYETEKAGDEHAPWSAVRAALVAVTSAVAAEDRDALVSAIGELRAAY